MAGPRRGRAAIFVVPPIIAFVAQRAAASLRMVYFLTGVSLLRLIQRFGLRVVPGSERRAAWS